MESEQPEGAPTEELRLDRRGAAAVAIFDRPAHQNAISQAMRRRLAGWYSAAARDPGVYCAVFRSELPGIFSVGGDERELMPPTSADIPEIRIALGEELQLCWTAECFSKPTVALIDGLVTGMAAGLTLVGTHRVAGEGYRFQMPVVRWGRGSYCGIAHAFARMPHAIGFYLGLTGEPIGRADAYRLGLVTHCVSNRAFDVIEAELANAEPVDPVLDSRHVDPGEGPVIAMAERIQRYFGAPTLPEIMARLAVAGPRDQEWASAVVGKLSAQSPFALALTDRAIRDAAVSDLRSTLLRDYRLAWRLLGTGAAVESAQTGSIGQGEPTRWASAGGRQMAADEVATYFADLGPDELVLPHRGEMQRARS